MTWESDTDSADKGDGRIWLNHVTPSSATLLYMDDNLNNGSTDISALVGSLDDPTASNSAVITIHEGANGGAALIFKVSGAVTDLTTHQSVAVTHGATVGSFTDGDIVGVLVAYSGDDGGGGTMDNVVDDTTPQLGGDLDCNGAQVQWSKGADVASAPALPVLTDGNYFDVTGTTGITSINTTGGPGTLIKLHFDGVVTLTHHATDLVLAGAANFTTAAGDELEFSEYAAGDYRMTGWSLAGTARGGGGGGAFLGEGAAGASVGDSGDIIRVNQNQLDTNQTFASGDNGSATGPLSITSGVTLTVTSGCTFAVI
jgi:hypothetical protein